VCYVTATRDPAAHRALFAGQRTLLSRLVPSRLRHRRSSSAAQEPVYQITSARRGVRDDVERRTRRYLISMGVRTACFLGAVAVGGWPRWVLLAGALVLPYLSVVFANGGRERIEEAALFHDESAQAITGPEL
jgi:hypothetical protein